MAHTVKSSSAIRGIQRTFELQKYCADKDFSAAYDATIRQFHSGLAYFLGDDGEARDRVLKDALVACLASRQEVEDDLRDRVNLPDEWDHDDAKWDLYREALAVTLLQNYYDSLPS